MYLEHFGMSTMPFVRDIPVEAMYESAEMKEADGRLYHAAENQELVVFTGESGCGKTAAIRKLVRELDADRFICGYISDSKLSPNLIYKKMLEAVRTGTESSVSYGRNIQDAFRERVNFIQKVAHRNLVFIIDEAHLLNNRCIEELRFILNTDYDSKSPMALILVGENALIDTRLQLPRFDAIRGRIDMNCVLHRLSRQESDEYIMSRLNYAGCTRQIFTDASRQVIYDASGGSMRVINHICDKTLTYTYQRKEHLIDDHMVRYVVDHEMIGTQGIPPHISGGAKTGQAKAG